MHAEKQDEGGESGLMNGTPSLPPPLHVYRRRSELSEPKWGVLSVSLGPSSLLQQKSPRPVIKPPF